MTTPRRRIDGSTTIAEKCQIPVPTVTWHAQRERWSTERKTHHLKVVEKR